MNGHVTAWIAAYYDGELHGDRQEQVEVHLGLCPDCQAELEELRRLSALLAAAPIPAFETSPERFAARVRMRLPQSAPRPPWRAGLKLAWQAIPLALIAGWVYFQALLSLAGLAALAGSATAISTGQGPALPLESTLSGTFLLNRLGSLLSATPWLAPAGLAVGWVFLSLGLSFFTGILLWGWVAGWWAHKRSALLLTSEVFG